MKFGDYEWDELLKSIEDKKCTPFVGAGASSKWISPDDISNKWATKYGYPLEDSDELSKVAQFVAIIRDFDLAPKKMLKEEFEKINPPNFELEEHRNTSYAVLADLKLPLYITTNYDNFLETALESRGKKPITEFCRWNQNSVTKDAPSIFDSRKKISLAENTPIVYHLHGLFDEPQSMVLTERDYMEFVIALNQVEPQSDLIPSIIKRQLLANTLLFIGYRLGDLNFRVIFQSVINLLSKSGEKRIAVQLPSKFSEYKQEKAKEYLEAYTKKMFEIDVYWGDATDFATELRKRLDKFRENKSKS